MKISRALFSYSGRQSNKSFLLRNPATCAVIGAPLHHGQPLQGVDLGPAIIRKHGLVNKLQQDEWVVEDRGDIPMDVKEQEAKIRYGTWGNARYTHEVGAMTRQLHEAVYAAAKDDKFALTLGGDHAIGIGSVAGILKAQPQTGILWVDAHADINSPQTSSSGNLHGMVLGFLMNLHNSKVVPGFEWLQDVPNLHESRLVYVGLRDVDQPEKKLIRQLGIKAFTMQDIDRWGIGKVMSMAIDHLCGRHVSPRPIHLSFDIDGIDPSYAPSTGTRVSGGLSYREAYYIAEALAETGLLKSMDMVEVNPLLGEGGQDGAAGNMTASMAVGLVAAAMGNSIL